jgi:hypothetical protein
VWKQHCHGGRGASVVGGCGRMGAQRRRGSSEDGCTVAGACRARGQRAPTGCIGHQHHRGRVSHYRAHSQPGVRTGSAASGGAAREGWWCSTRPAMEIGQHATGLNWPAAGRRAAVSSGGGRWQWRRAAAATEGGSGDRESKICSLV